MMHLTTRPARLCLAGGPTRRFEGAHGPARACLVVHRTRGARAPKAIVTNTINKAVGATRGMAGKVRRCVSARAVDGDDGTTKAKSDTLSSLSNILGDDGEEERKAREAEERIEKELAAARREQMAALEARKSADSSAPKIFNRAAYDDDEDMTAAQRGLAAVSYLLPLLDGLKYSKFLLMQFPLFGLALLPLKPAIDLWYSLGFLQIIVFFGLYLGVVNNQEMSRGVRFNAQQAILLDILLIVPDVLTRLVSGLGGDDALLTGGPGLEAQVLLYNTVFLYVYLTSVVGAGASALGKQVKLPIVGDAAETQIR